MSVRFSVRGSFQNQEEIKEIKELEAPDTPGSATQASKADKAAPECLETCELTCQQAYFNTSSLLLLLVLISGHQPQHGSKRSQEQQATSHFLPRAEGPAR